MPVMMMGKRLNCIWGIHNIPERGCAYLVRSIVFSVYLWVINFLLSCENPVALVFCGRVRVLCDFAVLCVCVCECVCVCVCLSVCDRSDRPVCSCMRAHVHCVSACLVPCCTAVCVCVHVCMFSVGVGGFQLCSGLVCVYVRECACVCVCVRSHPVPVVERLAVRIVDDDALGGVDQHHQVHRPVTTCNHGNSYNLQPWKQSQPATVATVSKYNRGNGHDLQPWQRALNIHDNVVSSLLHIGCVVRCDTCTTSQ